MKKFKIFSKIMSVILCLCLLAGCVDLSFEIMPRDGKNTAPANIDTSMFNVEYIDVGQGDSELLLFPDGKSVLIDAGEAENSKSVIYALAEAKVEKLALIVATHPHSDHIGGIPQVLESVETECFAMPYIPESSVSTTEVYEDMLSAVSKAKCKVIKAQAGETLLSGENYKIECLSPKSDAEYSNLNDYSAVLAVTYGNTRFLFTGDAETPIEKELIKAKVNIKADVLKAGHHGSSTASSLEFLKDVSPKYVMLSCGAGNKYGHPHPSVLNRLENLDIKYFITDENGSILAVSNGENVTVGIERQGE